MIYFMLLYPVNIQSIPRQKILESKHLLLAVNIIFLKPFHRSIWKKWKNKKICLCSSCILLSRLVNLTNSSRLKILKLTFLFHFIKHFCRCWQLLCVLGIETKFFFFSFSNTGVFCNEGTSRRNANTFETRCTYENFE